MSRHASAKPYAKALFEVALADQQPERVGQELATLARAMAEHADLRMVLTNPAVPPRAKRDIIDRVAEETGASPALRKLLALLADRDRLGLVPQLHEAFQARLLQHLGVVEAHVTTAVPLPPEKAEALTRSLERATGKQVRLSTAVDPAIMGGVVARLGSKLYDGSVARRLERLRERLTSER